MTRQQSDLESAAAGLTPRQFWFFLEHTESRPSPADEAYPGPQTDRYHVQVALYAIDTGAASDPLVLRTWSDSERAAFRIVRASAGTARSVPEFDTTPQEAFPSTGAAPDDLPAMILVSERLPGGRQYAPFARVHDGKQWGPWNRIAESRLDFVAASDPGGPAILDLAQQSTAAGAPGQAFCVRLTGIPARLPLDAAAVRANRITASVTVGSADAVRVPLQPRSDLSAEDASAGLSGDTIGLSGDTILFLGYRGTPYCFCVDWAALGR